MKIAVTGASGFIGKRFIELYANKFDDVIELNSRNAPLDNLNILVEKTKNIDVLVHIAFDHYYQFNQLGLDNIILACNKNGIKKIVFISTISVYHPELSGELTENSAYSTWLDPYSVEKQKLEKKLEGQTFDTIILQPTIVYGVKGSWTNFAINACKSQSLDLPNFNAVCNAVYVDDVAQAIFKSCFAKNVKFDKFLISGDNPTTWGLFYQKHNELLIKLGQESSLSITETKHQFHHNKLINVLFLLWYKSPIGNIFNLFVKQIKLLREKRQPRVVQDVNVLLTKELIPQPTHIVGITRQSNRCQFNVNIQKAKAILGYNPLYSFEQGMIDMEKKLNND